METSKNDTPSSTPVVKVVSDFPNEVICPILEHLNVRDLKAARLAHRSFAHNGRLILAPVFYVTETFGSFRRLLDFSKLGDEDPVTGTPIVKSVKTLCYLSFKMTACQCFDHRGLPIYHYVLPGIAISQNRLRFSRGWMAEKHMNIHGLTAALSKLEPKQIRVQCTINPAWLNHKHFAYIANRFHEVRNGFNRHAFHPHHQGLATRSFIAMLIAMTTSNCQATSFLASTGLHFLQSPELPHFQGGIKALKHICLETSGITQIELSRLPLNYGWDLVTPSYFPLIQECRWTADDAFKKISLAAFLQPAQRLEELCIFLPNCQRAPEYSDKLSLLGLTDFTWPKLHTLRLDEITCKVDDLYTVIKNHQNTLQYAEFWSAKFLFSGAKAILPDFFNKLSILRKEGTLTLKSISFGGQEYLHALYLSPAPLNIFDNNKRERVDDNEADENDESDKSDDNTEERLDPVRQDDGDVTVSGHQRLIWYGHRINSQRYITFRQPDYENSRQL